MADIWPANVTHTHELGSQRGAVRGSFDDEINAFLQLGWRIINSYVEGKGPDSTREECVCLMGWTGPGDPQFPNADQD